MVPTLHRLPALPLAALLLAPLTALAHVPFLEEADYTPERPYVVKDITNSKSIHARIGTPGDVDIYVMDVTAPLRIFTQTDIPWCPQYEDFGVSYALTGPGLPPPAIPLPVELPPGHGAVVVRDNVAAGRRTWDEPFSGRRMWVGDSFALDDAPPGRYQMVVWNERDQTGDYIAVIGEDEIFNAPELRQVAATSPKLRDGADLMVDCNPTVSNPVSFGIGRATRR